MDYGTGGGPGSGKSTLTIHLSIPGSAINTYAYVDAIGGEDEVHTLYALFFEPATDGSGIFIEAINISPESGEYTSGQTIEMEIPDGSSITRTNAYSIFFIANPEYYLDSYGGITRDWSTEVFSGKTENQVKQLRIDIQGNTSVPGSSLYYGYKPFHQKNLMMTGSIYKEDGQDMITAELTRIVSRFDIVNKAENYVLETASIWNGFPEQTIGDINFSDFSIDRIKRLYGIDVEDNGVTGGLYTYENFVAVPEQNDEYSTCLILGIRNTDTDNLGYYRVNANHSGRPQQLRRNNAYTFTIKSVTGNGDNSEEDAYNSGKNEINVQINDWDVDDQGCIVFDGDNILALGTNNVVFNKLGGDIEYRVFTSGEGTLSISDEYIPYGMSYEFKDNMVYIHADPSEVNKGGYIEFQFGKLKATMYITQTGEIDQMLTLSHNMLPMFGFEDGLVSEEVTVTSSGPWTAKIYNDDNAFVFTGTSNIDLTGDDQDKFTITTIDENVDLKPRYAFVHAVLDANPNISAVTIISQNGVNDIILNPEPAQLIFDAEGGQVTASTDYTITVDTGDDAIEWAAEIYGTYKQYFTATVNATAKTVTVEAVGRNPETIELSAQLRIYLVDNPAIYKEVDIIQYVHSLSVTPTTVPSVITSGGSSEVFTVTSSADWKAEITSTGNDAYFNSTANLYVITGPDGQGTFYVTFPALTSGGVVPEAIVTVTIPDTNFKQTVSVKQTALTGTIINVQNFGTLYGYLTPENTYYRYNYVEQLWQSLNSYDWFGPEGTVFCGGVNFLEYSPTPDASTGIYVINSFDGDRSQANSARTWLEANDNRVLLLLSDDRTSTLLDYLGLATEGYAGSGGVQVIMW
ncbi:MAG: hypothetical protein LUH15_21445 [Tannerellaceae bacterium]|nr:hypothetical protein [Tannerellaceae bacterium]